MKKLIVNCFVLIFLFKLSASNCGCKKLKREVRAADEYSTQKNKPKSIVGDIGDKEEKCAFEASLKKFIQDQGNVNSLDDKAVLIPGGMVTIGTNIAVFEDDKESPERVVEIKDFYMDKYEVSNHKFAEFVSDTGYVTDAEKFGDSFVFKGHITKEMQDKYIDFRVASAQWWYKIDKVDWRHPEGVDSSLKDRSNHPVVHVSWKDAVEYCKWKGMRLPTEVEWETACRGGRKGKLYPWGDLLNPRDEHWMNIWQGDFPDTDRGDDGFKSTCPVDQFNQNKYGLFNIVGNVWEWTSDAWENNAVISDDMKRVKKGGSFLCHKSYCYRYRCAARSQNTADSSAGNLGFRCARDI